MEIVLAIIIGVLYGIGIYMMMRRSLVKLILGLALLGHASNLLLFSQGNIARGLPPVIEEGSKYIDGFFADPIPQALILTAIVIGFGTQAFAIVLARRVYQAVNSDDVDGLKMTDEV
jgi:multicomponent Na+:H+ antiporter subunit C